MHKVASYVSVSTLTALAVLLLAQPLAQTAEVSKSSSSASTVVLHDTWPPFFEVDGPFNPLRRDQGRSQAATFIRLALPMPSMAKPSLAATFIRLTPPMPSMAKPSLAETFRMPPKYSVRSPSIATSCERYQRRFPVPQPVR